MHKNTEVLDYKIAWTYNIRLENLQKKKSSEKIPFFQI